MANDLQSANGRIEPLITLRANDETAGSLWLDNADAYVHLRYWGDAAQLSNGPHVNTVGQGAYATRVFHDIRRTDGQHASASTSTRPMLLRRI